MPSAVYVAGCSATYRSDMYSPGTISVACIDIFDAHEVIGKKGKEINVISMTKDNSRE